MRRKRRRMLFVLVGLVLLGSATALVLSAFQDSLVFFYSPVGHVGIYIGNGQMVHAPTSGSVVKVVDMNYMPGFNSARRLA